MSAAAGKLTNAADATAFVDVDSLDRDDQGNVTDATVSAAVEALLTERPYLAAKAGTGSADQGQRRDAEVNFKDQKQFEAELAKFKLKPRR
jgi:exosome complex RNA-binding protein Rrp42 (RNase PH superfamily)